MKKTALLKDSAREIQKSLGRFFSIMVIVALGVAFLAGIRVSSPMMKNTTDQYMDDYGMMDLSVISTVGLEAADCDAINDLEQVESVTGSISINALATIGEQQSVVKVHSLDDKDPKDPKFINKPLLVEGRWPSAPNECLIDGTKLTRLPIEVGETLTLTTGTDEPIEDVLTNTTYKVVGVMHSPYYMHFERGTAEIGNGSVASYIYIPEENFENDVYTELFITLKDTKALDSYSEDYKASIEAFKNELEPMMKKRADARYEKLVVDAKQAIEEGEKTFHEEKQKAMLELEKAAQELQQAEKEIKENEKKLEEGEKQAEIGFQQAQQALEKAKLELAQKQKNYEEGREVFEVEKQKTQVALNQAKEQLEQGKAHLKALKIQHQQIEIQLETADDATKEILLSQKATLEDEINKLTAWLQQSEKAYEKGMAELQAQEETLKASGLLIAQGQNTLATKEAQLKKEKASTLKTLEDSNNQLEEGKKELEEGKQKYATAKADAEKKLSEAEAKLTEGRTQLQQMKSPKVYLLGREANYGYANYENAAQTIDRMGKVFPLFFFVVAALVCLTTMTRMVDEQRITIGTYKALGYSTIAIMGKYILYAGIASVVGSIIGLFVGFSVFPHTIYNAYGMMFTTPPLLTKFYPKEAIGATLIMSALTIFAASFTTIKALKEQPTELMRPKAPPAGKRILLERIPFIWKRFNFFQKVVARNIFRYKKKFFMTTIGIAGCTALLVAGLGLKQSIMSIVERQYSSIFKYNLEVTLKDEDNNTLQDKPWLNNQLPLSSQNIKVGVGDKERRTTLRVIKDTKALPTFIQLRERQTQSPLTLEKGAIISEKLAKALQVTVGDRIWFENSDLERYETTVSGITENYIGHYMYMADTEVKAVTHQQPTYNQLLVQIEDDSNEERIAQMLTEDEEVVSFAFTTKYEGNFSGMTKSLNTVVMILVVSAALLAFVVLYNLTTINISERFREIATIKVLGFDDFKVTQYIYRENRVLTLMGGLVGLLLGKALFLYIIVTAEMDEMMFGRELYASSYGKALLLTFFFAMLVNILMHFKLQKIQMVESLKSVD